MKSTYSDISWYIIKRLLVSQSSNFKWFKPRKLKMNDYLIIEFIYLVLKQTLKVVYSLFFPQMTIPPFHYKGLSLLTIVFLLVMETSSSPSSSIRYKRKNDESSLMDLPKEVGISGFPFSIQFISSWCMMMSPWSLLQALRVQSKMNSYSMY